MTRFFEQNINSSLEVLKRNLLASIDEVRRDPSNMEDFIQMVGLVMHRSIGKNLTNQQISYVTSRMSDSEEKTRLGTGEGKATANMLLLASQTLLANESKETTYPVRALAERDLQDFQHFFENLGLKTELKNNEAGGVTLIATPAETTLQAQVQQTGRIGR